MATINRYIRRFYCNIDKVDQTEIVNDLLNRFHSIPQDQLLNQFYSFNTVNNQFYNSLKEEEVGRKMLLTNNEGLVNLNENSILPFNKIIKWTLLKYNPFHELLIKLEYPIFIHQDKIWWGEFNVYVNKYSKIYELFDKIEIDTTDGDGPKENLIEIINLLKTENLIPSEIIAKEINFTKKTKKVKINNGKTSHEIILKNMGILSRIVRKGVTNYKKFN